VRFLNGPVFSRLRLWVGFNLFCKAVAVIDALSLVQIWPMRKSVQIRSALVPDVDRSGRVRSCALWLPHSLPQRDVTDRGKDKVENLHLGPLTVGIADVALKN